MKLLDAFTGMFNSVLRLAAEVKKSMRRVNALEKIHIPDYTDVLQYIANTLEESERESFFVLKMIKARLSGARSRARGAAERMAQARGIGRILVSIGGNERSLLAASTRWRSRASSAPSSSPSMWWTRRYSPAS